MNFPYVWQSIAYHWDFVDRAGVEHHLSQCYLVTYRQCEFKVFIQ